MSEQPTRITERAYLIKAMVTNKEDAKLLKDTPDGLYAINYRRSSKGIYYFVSAIGPFPDVESLDAYIEARNGRRTPASQRAYARAYRAAKKASQQSAAA